MVQQGKTKKFEKKEKARPSVAHPTINWVGMTNAPANAGEDAEEEGEAG